MDDKKLFTIELTGADRLGGSARFEDLQANIRKTFHKIRHYGEWYVSVSYSIFSLHKKTEFVKNKKTGKWEYSEEADIKKQIDKHFSNWHCHLIVYAEKEAGKLCNDIVKTWVNVAKEEKSNIKAEWAGQEIIPCYDCGKIIYTLWQELHKDCFPVNSIETQRKIIDKAIENFPDKKVPSTTVKIWRDNIEQGLQQFGGAQWLINETYFAGDSFAKKQNEIVEKLWADVRIKRDFKNMSIVFDRIRSNLKRQDLRKLMQNYHKATWKELDLDGEPEPEMTDKEIDFMKKL